MYSRKKGIYEMIVDLIPKSVLYLISEKTGHEVVFNSNYYLKSTFAINVNPLTAFNFLVDIDSEIKWKMHLVEIDQSGYSFMTIFQKNKEKFSNGKFQRNTTIIDNTIYVTDYNEKNVLNIATISSKKKYSYSTITFITLLNNSSPYFYFKSVQNSVTNFISFLRIKLKEDHLILAKTQRLIDSEGETNLNNK
jgi:hypothetical protein